MVKLLFGVLKKYDTINVKIIILSYNYIKVKLVFSAGIDII